MCADVEGNRSGTHQSPQRCDFSPLVTAPGLSRTVQIANYSKWTHRGEIVKAARPRGQAGLSDHDDRSCIKTARLVRVEWIRPLIQCCSATGLSSTLCPVRQAASAALTIVRLFDCAEWRSAVGGKTGLSGEVCVSASVHRCAAETTYHMAMDYRARCLEFKVC